jgi:hypothetical protein
MTDHEPGQATDDPGIAAPASSHGSDLDPRVDEAEDEPAQTEGADETGP